MRAAWFFVRENWKAALVLLLFVSASALLTFRSCSLGPRIPFVDADKLEEDQKLPELFK